MKGRLQQALKNTLRITGLEYLPVQIRKGYAAGARWTLFPWSAYWRGNYEVEMSTALQSLGDITGWSCWDLGAHFGYYSVGMALRVGGSGQVSAFEPFPDSFARLDHHRKMNPQLPLQVFSSAVSDANGSQTFYTDTSEGDTTVHLAYEGERVTANTPSTKVPTVRLDDLAASGVIRRPDLIKVDVEGHGHRALSGAYESIKAKRPIIIMGFHSPQEVAGTRSLLDPLGYRWTPLRRDAREDLNGENCILRSS